MISILAMSSVSGMLITLFVVESASSPTYLCGNEREGSDGSDVSIGSESSGGLGLGERVGAGWGEVQLLLGSSASPGSRRLVSATELALE